MELVNAKASIYLKVSVSCDCGHELEITKLSDESGKFDNVIAVHVNPHECGV